MMLFPRRDCGADWRASPWIGWLTGLLIFGLVYWLRLHLTQPVEASGDSFEKWYEVKRLVHGLEYSRLDHHTMRWGINFPVFVAQKLFGTAPSVYYLVPSALSALSAVFVYRIGTRLRGPLLGVVALVLFVFHPQIVSAASQLFPGIFSTTWLLGAVWFLLRYGDDRRAGWLLVSALFLFLAYGAKVTNLFVLPAMLYHVWWLRREIRPVLLYGGILLAGFLVETVVVDAMLGDFTLPGRLALLGGHLNKMVAGIDGVQSALGVFMRWDKLPNYWYLHTLTGFFAALWFIGHRRRHPAEFLLALCLFAFSLLITFGIVGLKPVRYMLPLETRYLTLTIPFTLLLTLSGAARLGRRQFALAVLLLFIAYPMKIYEFSRKVPHRAVYGIDEFRDRVMDHLEDGWGIMFGNAKKARLYRAMFVEDRLALGLDRGYRKLPLYVVPPDVPELRNRKVFFLLTLDPERVEKGLLKRRGDRLKVAVRLENGLAIRPEWDDLW